MSYDINFVAEELFLTPQELQEVYDIYFTETSDLVQSCYQAMAIQDSAQVGKIMHLLKGSSNNLRFTSVASIAGEIEILSISGQNSEVLAHLRELEQEILLMKKEIESIYQQI